MHLGHYVVMEMLYLCGVKGKKRYFARICHRISLFTFNLSHYY